MSKTKIGGIMQCTGLAELGVMTIPDRPAVAGKIMRALGDNDINVQFVVQCIDTQDYDHLERPAYLRHNAALKQENLAEDLLMEDPDYLDIPAFLRRQAD